jgi:hypothetical protein
MSHHRTRNAAPDNKKKRNDPMTASSKSFGGLAILMLAILPMVVFLGALSA